MKGYVRFFTFILIISVVMTQFGIVCHAADSEAENSAAAQDIVVKSAELTDYDKYLTDNNGELYNGEPITTDLESFTADRGKELVVSSYANVDKALILDSSVGTVEWEFTIPATAFYEISLDYIAVSGSESRIETSILLNGSIPYDSAEIVSLPRLWKNAKEIAEDSDGNDIAPAQIQVEELQTVSLSDLNGLYLQPLRFYLQEGSNKIALRVLSGKFALSRINLKSIADSVSYKEYYDSLKNEKIYDGEDIIIQGQDASFKSSKELRPISDKSDPANTPSSAFNTKINCIGGNNWDSSGERITWEFSVPKSALY
ncbi:MAG: hypothetical protein J6T73_00095, partial [Clostridia bacterium]|nr:hypothetical protein [Clostridia bacterium]